ncbi:MAG: GNAT family N-acetyltransferase [Fimbriimonadaceae bacterium]|nr:GNAT family N-acetyltransferase [Fimbriimonadaceae bacterium]
MEFRPIVADEVETFLRLLCDVFELDIGRASSVFTSEPFFDLNRKWAAFEDGQMRAILTTTPLIFGWGRAIGISGVATHPRFRSRGIAARLLDAAIDQAVADDEGAAYLFAGDPRLYAKRGFKVVDEVIRGPIAVQKGFVSLPAMASEEVRSHYENWVAGSDDRLRRDLTRWKLWDWHMRPCEPFGGGYLCLEVGVVREAIVPMRAEAWPVAPGTEWIGLKGLTQEAGVPLERTISEAFVMARNTDRLPQMFITDQF